MECAGNDIGNAEYLRQFNARVVRDRVPLSGNLALTYRCNLQCRHCYADDPAAPGRRELDADELKEVISSAADAGCMSVLLTGGDPLVRTDFAEIYRHAKMTGLRVAVFTNATLVDDAIVDLWREFPPVSVEVTLYGATAAPHEAVTGVSGSFEAAVSGIRRLMEAKLQPRLKTIVMKGNLGEVEAVERMARDWGLRFRMDAAVFPTLKGGRGPMDLRVTPAEAASREFADPARATDWREFYERQKAIPPDDRLYSCGAGKTTFYIDPYGWLYPCLMVRTVRYDLMSGCFGEGWKDLVSKMDAKRIPEGSACRTCTKKSLCGYCPGFAEMEAGSEEAKSEYLCSLGDERLARISTVIGQDAGRYAT